MVRLRISGTTIAMKVSGRAKSSGQSAGSRYESGRNIPRPVQMLLRIAYGTKAQAAKQVEALRPGAAEEAAS